MKTYNFNAKIITPVHIGSGNFLSPDSPLLEYKNGKFVIKNTTYVSNDDPEFIMEHIHTNGRAFIPGSSIKGALRTAYLYKFLKSPFGKKQLIKWLKKLQTVLRNVDEDSSKDEKKKADKAIMKAYNDLIDSKCFGEAKDYKLWNNLKINDSKPFPDGSTAVYETRRFFLESGKDGIPVFLEALLPTQTFDFKIKYEPYDNKYAGFHIIGRNMDDAFGDKARLKRLINDFIRDLVQYERKVLDYDEVSIHDVFDEYRNFLDEISEGLNNGYSYLRLGQGKMIYYQTIGMAIYNMKPEENFDEETITNAWYDYLYFLRKFKDFGENEPDFFPKTRKLTYKPYNIPLGWIKLN